QPAEDQDVDRRRLHRSPPPRVGHPGRPCARHADRGLARAKRERKHGVMQTLQGYCSLAGRNKPMGGEALAGSVDTLNPDKPKRILIVASNPAVSKQTGWPIGFWWAEVTHPYWALTERGYQVDIASPDGGK